MRERSRTGWVAAWLALPLAAVAQGSPLLTPEQRAWVAHQPVWRVGPEQDYGPFIYADAQGQIQGLSVDALARVAAQTGLRYQMATARPLHEQLAAIRQGDLDLLTSLRPTAERSAYLLFTTPYVTVPAVLVSRDAAYGSLAPLAGRRAAVGKGYAVEAYVRSRFPAVQWQAVPSDVEALQGVARGEFDAAVADLASVAFVQRTRLLGELQVGDSVGFEYALSFAVRRDLPQLREVLDAGIRNLSAEDRRQLRERWLQPGGALQPRPRVLWLALGAVVCGALLLALWWWRRPVLTPGEPRR